LLSQSGNVNGTAIVSIAPKAISVDSCHMISILCSKSRVP
jgi:hypothetical protein